MSTASKKGSSGSRNRRKKSSTTSSSDSSASSSSSTGSSTNGVPIPKSKSKKIKYDPLNPTHKDMLKGSVSDDDMVPQKNKRVKIIFGDEEDDQNDLDERGNVKDLIDYSDEEDYKVYNTEMARREKLEKSMANRPHIIIGENCEDEEDDDEHDDMGYPEDEDEEYEDGEQDSPSVAEAARKHIGILIPLLMAGKEHKQKQPKNTLPDRIMNSGLSASAKNFVMARLNNADLDKPKQIEWIESLLSIPFGKLEPLVISVSDPKEKLYAFFQNVMQRFDSQVHGLGHVKAEIVNYLAQAITSQNRGTPRILALYGSAGVGKTYIIRTALADSLHRPIKCINMGGIKDAVYFTGFDYTYSSARYGMLVQSLIEKQIMNPIICFEEVDKISETKDGLDIQNILMHVTDPEQNNAFQDKYFAGIDIDLSKVVFVMTLNDPSLLHPILLNRLHLVQVPDPTEDDKVKIAHKHVIPKICKNIGFDERNISFPVSTLKYIINNHCQGDKGLRTLKTHIESVILRMNLINLIGADVNGSLKVTFPVTITQGIVDSIIVKPNEDGGPCSHMYM